MNEVDFFLQFGFLSWIWNFEICEKKATVILFVCGVCGNLLTQMCDPVKSAEEQQQNWKPWYKNWKYS